MKPIRTILAAATLLLASHGAIASAADFLVSTDWLEKNLNDPKVRVIEVSVNPGQFERGHVSGAVSFAWHTGLVDPVRRDIVGKADFEQLLRRAGVSRDSTVVL